MADFAELETREGVRMTWCARCAAPMRRCGSRRRASAATDSDATALARNVWPYSRIEATRMVMPFGVMITPLRCALL
jgi:hypothetical protein